MSILKHYSEVYARSVWRCRGFVTAAPRPLQGRKKNEEETCQNVKDAAEAVKEGAREVRKTSEFIRDTASNAADSVTKMTKEVTDKVTETAEAITDKAKDSVSTVSGVWGTAKNTTEIIKDKIIGK
ncbi:uncharacterized protein [Euphorbia lathyris]|uniref:uncharacterized protein n=1 Tax=Euphorbia lathyris TaxID=212925 RepID=UPI0033141954